MSIDLEELNNSVSDQRVVRGDVPSSKPILSKNSESLPKHTVKSINNAGEYVNKSKPIEYKQIDSKYLKARGYKVRVSSLEYDKEGYLTDYIINSIDFKEESTVAINVGTGCGKTTAIYKVIEQVLKEDEDVVVIMASPYLSLVEKDYRYLVGKKFKIDSALITDYRDLKKDVEQTHTYQLNHSDFIHTYVNDKKVHITTIHALLGNPGNVAFEQAAEKRNYINHLFNYCRENKKKVVLVFDEIHASIDNFHDEFIFNLFRWKNLVSKIIVSTATWTEPINMVLQHLAYITDDRISVLEAPRKPIDKPSTLDLFFTDKLYNQDKDDSLTEFLNYWIKKHIKDDKNYHILSYSKKLSEQIRDKLIDLGFEEPNLVVSKRAYRKNSGSKKETIFDKRESNIGTAFSTGVNIDAEDDLFIILFPCKYSDDTVVGEEGIFTSGLPAILQAVARMRKKGKILFVIPPMRGRIKCSYTNELIQNLPEKFHKGVPEFKEDFLEKERSYLDIYLDRKLKRSNEFVNNYFEDIKLTPKINRPSITPTDKDVFILERGQEYLKYTCYKSGKYITPYVLWAAMNNQFINCTLDTVSYLKRNVKVINFKRSKLFEDVRNYLETKGVLSFTPEHPVIAYLEKVRSVLTSNVEGGQNNRIVIKIDGETFSVNDFMVRHETFLPLINFYFNIIHKNKDRFSTVDEYLRYRVRHPAGNSYTEYQNLNKIRTDFRKKYQGQSFLSRDISQLPYFDKKITASIIENINIIEKKDPVVKSISKKGSFWKFDQSDSTKIIDKFIQSFIDRGKPDRKGRREIL